MNTVAEKPITQNFAYEAVASSPGVARRLASLARRKKTTVFSHVTGTAQPFLVALICERAGVSGGNFWGAVRHGTRAGAVSRGTHHLAAVGDAVPASGNRGGGGARSPTRKSPPSASPCSSGSRPATNARWWWSTGTPSRTRSTRTGSLRKTSVKLERGTSMDRARLVEQLVEAGYSSAVQVSQRGEFSVRGGVMDIFSWQQATPLRVEWFDGRNRVPAGI